MDEATREAGGRRSFSFMEVPPSVPDQASIYLTDADPLAAVFPVHPGSFTSGGFVYGLGDVTIEDSVVIVDLYSFSTEFSGDALVAPWEQSAFIGELPAGEYEFMLRRWSLTAEDRLGFDPATVPIATPPLIPEEGRIVSFNLPSRFVTTQSFPFVVATTNIPEPRTAVMVIGIIAMIACFRYRRHLCLAL